MWPECAAGTCGARTAAPRPAPNLTRSSSPSPGRCRLTQAPPKRGAVAEEGTVAWLQLAFGSEAGDAEPRARGRSPGPGNWTKGWGGV